MTTVRAPRELIGDESEAHFQQRVIQLARYLGWGLRYHAYDSMGSAPGFPDWVLVNRRLKRAILVELKSQHGRLSKDQAEWHQTLRECGEEAYIWRPSDWAEIERVLGVA